MVCGKPGITTNPQAPHSPIPTFGVDPTVDDTYLQFPPIEY